MKFEKVALIGGSGFVGRHITHRLRNSGHSCRILTRHAHRIRSMGVSAELREVDPFDVDALSGALSGCQAVIHLVGILNPSSTRQDFRAVHVRLTEIIVEACHQAGVKRLLYMSALQADQASGTSEYLRSKGEGENRAHTLGQPGIAVTSFRPSVIFGPDDSFINRFAALLRIPGPMPLACPDARFAPVYVGDVAAAFGNALEDPASFGKRYELCGPNVFSLEEIVRFIARNSGRQKLILRMPDWASRLQAQLLQLVPGKPFTLDNYQSLRTASVCTNNGLAALGVTPTPMCEYVGRMLHERRDGSRLDRFRSTAGR